MISKIEALNYRCLRHVSQPLGPFHILVGPNASGKTTFLDVVAFLGDMLSDGLHKAINKRTNTFQDLVWGRKEHTFQLAVEADIPESFHQEDMKLGRSYKTVRYEVIIKYVIDSNEIGIAGEQLFLVGTKIKEGNSSKLQRPDKQRDSIITTYASGYKPIVEKQTPIGAVFHSEVLEKGAVQSLFSFNIGFKESALMNLPYDEKKFPVATWFRESLKNGIQLLILNNQSIRMPSPPGKGYYLKTDGSNLPWVIDNLKNNSPENYNDWISHLQTSLPDLEGFRIVVKDEDRHAYILLQYKGGLEIPSWVASDGTLRMLALTLPAYLPDSKGIYLIEEPENGVHPLALETIYQSLSSVYDGQVLVATHSPLLVSLAKPEEILCFSKDEDGAAQIISGDKHPMLKDWSGRVDLGTMFASGVLD